jgi:predicted nicotinamide N-methyase
LLLLRNGSTTTGGCAEDDDRYCYNSRQPSVRTQMLQLDGEKVRITSRSVPISAPEWYETVWEWEKPAAVVERYWDEKHLSHTGNKGKAATSSVVLLDPFGLVSWPGSVVAAQELMRHRHMVHDKRVLVLGAGVGIEALAAARLGASSVLATDIHPVTLKLLEYGSQQAGFEKIISTAIFDIASSSEAQLPACDLMIVADVLYDDKLAAHVARRCLEARSVVPSPPTILISDSQRFVQDFELDVSTKMLAIGQTGIAWLSRELPAFTGSGVLIDDDQTYKVDARVMWIGLTTKPGD